MFPSFYIYNENNFQTIFDITDKSASTIDDSSKYFAEDDSSIDSDFLTHDESLSIEPDLESIYSDFLTHDESLSIEPDLESIYSELSSLPSGDSDNFESSDDDIETNITDDETIESNPMYVSSGISIKLLNEELYEDDDDEEFDDRELVVIIEVQKCSTNYTDTFVRTIYKKKTYNFEKIINASIAIFTFAFILNWFC
jgi:hypothetical protein